MWPLGNMDVRATTRPVVPSSQVEQIACRFAAMDPYAGTPAPRKLTGITPTSGLPLIGMSGKPGQPTGGAETHLSDPHALRHVHAITPRLSAHLPGYPAPRCAGLATATLLG